MENKFKIPKVPATVGVNVFGTCNISLLAEDQGPVRSSTTTYRSGRGALSVRFFFRGQARQSEESDKISWIAGGDGGYTQGCKRM